MKEIERPDRQIWLARVATRGNWKLSVSYSTLGFALVYGEKWLDLIAGPFLISYDKPPPEPRREEITSLGGG